MDGFKKEYALFLLKNFSYLQEKRSMSNYSEMCNDCEIVISGIEKLDQQTREIIDDVYFKRNTWQEVMDKRFVSHTTIARCRKKALNAVIYELERNKLAV